MAIKPGMGRKSSSKNPPIFSHEFVIQNHADIVSCIAMVFVIGLMVQTTNSIASMFISLHHSVNISNLDLQQQENLKSTQYLYESGIKDYCAIFFYTLICVIMHAILQEYVLDKISKKLHLSKYKLSLFNESGQLVVFYFASFLCGIDIIIREGYFSKFSLLWDNFPNHPMSFLHKLYFIIQLSYYLHMLPELYFQKIKKEDQQPKIIHALSGFSIIALAYFLNFQRIALVLLTLHYCSELVAHSFQIVDVFDRDEKYIGLRFINRAIFVCARFITMVISVLTLYYGVGNTSDASRGLLTLAGVTILQGYLIYSFITEQLRYNRERQREAKLHAQQLQQSKKKSITTAISSSSSSSSSTSSKRNKNKESDLPEADQTHYHHHHQQQQSNKMKVK